MKKFLKRTFVYDWLNEIKFLFEDRKNRDLVEKFKKLKILDDEATVDMIVKNRMSFARFGDGEFRWMRGNDKYVANFQDNDELMSERLKDVMNNNDDKLLIGISVGYQKYKDYVSLDKFFWRKMINDFGDYTLHFLDYSRVYGDAALTRFYMSYKNKDRIRMGRKVKNLKRIWDDRDIVFVEGSNTKLGVGNDLFANAKSIKRILAPSRNAFGKIKEIENAVIDNVNKNDLLLISLGPTATILAADLCKEGYQAIDIGHIDIEYEWYRMAAKRKIGIPGKDTYEAAYNSKKSIKNSDGLGKIGYSVGSVIANIQEDG